MNDSLTFRKAKQLLQAHQLLLDVLNEAQNSRSKLSEIQDGEPAWAKFERQTMMNLVNLMRAERGLPKVSLQEIERVERTAAGHVDYSSKFALYCAEIAIGETP